MKTGPYKLFTLLFLTAVMVAGCEKLAKDKPSSIRFSVGEQVYKQDWYHGAKNALNMLITSSSTSVGFEYDAEENVLRIGAELIWITWDPKFPFRGIGLDIPMKDVVVGKEYEMDPAGLNLYVIGSRPFPKLRRIPVSAASYQLTHVDFEKMNFNGTFAFKGSYLYDGEMVPFESTGAVFSLTRSYYHYQEDWKNYIQDSYEE